MTMNLLMVIEQLYFMWGHTNMTSMSGMIWVCTCNVCLCGWISSRFSMRFSVVTPPHIYGDGAEPTTVVDADISVDMAACSGVLKAVIHKRTGFPLMWNQRPKSPGTLQSQKTQCCCMRHLNADAMQRSRYQTAPRSSIPLFVFFAVSLKLMSSHDMFEQSFINHSGQVWQFNQQSKFSWRFPLFWN